MNEPLTLSTETGRKLPLLSARQVTVAAVFGGIAFAFEALKIVIPGYLPGFNFNFLGMWLTLATMIGGPWVGITVGVIDCLSGEVGLLGIPGYSIHALVLALLYPRVYAIGAKRLRVAAFWGINFLALVIQYWYWIFLYAFILKVMPVKVQLVFHVSGPLWVYALIYTLVPSIVLISAPGFVAPDWGWTRARRLPETRTGSGER